MQKPEISHPLSGVHRRANIYGKKYFNSWTACSFRTGSSVELQNIQFFPESGLIQCVKNSFSGFGKCAVSGFAGIWPQRKHGSDKGKRQQFWSGSASSGRMVCGRVMVISHCRQSRSFHIPVTQTGFTKGGWNFTESEYLCSNYPEDWYRISWFPVMRWGNRAGNRRLKPQNGGLAMFTGRSSQSPCLEQWCCFSLLRYRYIRQWKFHTQW